MSRSNVEASTQSRQKSFVARQRRRHAEVDAYYKDKTLRWHTNDYLHYHAENAEGMEVIRFQYTKQSLLRDQIAQFKRLKSRANTRSRQVLGEDLDSLLGLYATEKGEAEIQAQVEADYSATKTLAQDLTGKYSSIEDAVTSLLYNLESAETVMNEFCKASDAVRQWNDVLNSSDVFDTVVSAIVKGEKLSGSKGLASQEGCNKVLELVLSKYGSTAVKEIKDATGVPTEFIHLKMLIESLADVGTIVGGHTVKHSDSDRRAITSENDLIQEAAIKMGKYLESISAVALEAATASGYLQSQVEFNKAMKGVETSIETVGKQKVSANSRARLGMEVFAKVIHGESYGNIMDWSEKMFDNYTNKLVSKPDVKITMTKDGVRVLAGVSVKNTIFVKDQKNVDVKITDETPLFTLLKRYCGFKDHQMNKTYQLLSAIDSNGSSGFDQEWEQLKEYVKYISVLRSIIGFSSKGSPVNYYIVLNRQFYSVLTVLENLLYDESFVKMNGEVDPKYAERSWYVGQNRKNWEKPMNRGDWTSARIRSDKTMNDAKAGLVAAKMRIVIQLSHLSELYGQGLHSII